MRTIFTCKIERRSELMIVISYDSYDIKCETYREVAAYGMFLIDLDNILGGDFATNMRERGKISIIFFLNKNVVTIFDHVSSGIIFLHQNPLTLETRMMRIRDLPNNAKRTR